MKTFSIALVLAALTLWRASAQVTVQITTAQDEFLPSEAIPLAIKITNFSGRQIHLGTDPEWLTFSVEAADGSIIARSSDVPVLGAFDLESSQQAIKRVDIAPYFVLARPGRYKVTATLRIKAWSMTVTSKPKSFDVVTGAELWSENFGVPSTNGTPVMRTFTLEEANYLRDQLRLYVQLGDVAEARILKVVALGPMVSFGHPQAQVDGASRLHVLWQTSGKSYNYCIVAPDGTLLKRDYYDNFNSRPRLNINDQGQISVIGGTLRTPMPTMPAITAPVQPPAASTNSAK